MSHLSLKNTPRMKVLANNLENGKFANIKLKTMLLENNGVFFILRHLPAGRDKCFVVGATLTNY